MASDSGRFSLHAKLDIEQILVEAKNRWLRPAEICEILENHQHFRIAPEAPQLPPSGSLFLFDRKKLRYFRKDGHNWRKKKDGKTVKEAHERLKVGSVDVLHCYYAHGEENENFQRRSYWLLEEELSRIVLVHYREVNGNRTNYNRMREVLDTNNPIQNNEDINSSVSSRLQSHDHVGPSLNTDTTSLNNNTHASEYEDAQSAYNHHTSSGFHSFLDTSQRPYYPDSISNNFEPQFQSTYATNLTSTTQGNGVKSIPGTSLANIANRSLDFAPWDNINMMENNPPPSFQSVNFQPSFPSPESSTMNMTHGFGHENEMTRGNENDMPRGEWNHLELFTAPPSIEMTHQEEGTSSKLEAKDPFSHIKEGLKKLDSFDRWMRIELLEDVDDLNTQPSNNSGADWETVGNQGVVDDSVIGGTHVQLESFLLGPSLSHDQYFTIVDFSPNWVYSGSQIKILITGRFLKSQQESTIPETKWACMFGEVEVPAEVISEGVLQCVTPVHKPDRVPFYITCSNRLACSEVREFEFRALDENTPTSFTEGHILVTFAKILSFESVTHIPRKEGKISTICDKVSSLFKEDENEWKQITNLNSDEKIKDVLLQRLLKEKLHKWLLHKVIEGEIDGKGPSVLDSKGQGVLHLAAALGYDWAIRPIIASGVSINFRDVNGWTALHWAALYGRERTVVLLISLGANPGALTDPSLKHKAGKTPADLASTNGHKGIAGYLAESALSSHLSSLKLKEKKEGENEDFPIQTIRERKVSSIISDEDLPLKDTLAAVRNATQDAATIHELFRLESFERKRFNGEFGDVDERALSIVTRKGNRTRLHDEPVHAAARRIQNKFRSYKGRKDFLLIRQRIIKIQAHFRGHQVRKNYKKITWSVGILEKIILRWRRKGSGLRGFKPETNNNVGPTVQNEVSKEDEYDFLIEGRKQTEERLHKALARVKSMVQYPEARDQYRRLLNVVSEMQEPKDEVVIGEEEVNEFEDLVDLQALFDADDMFMSEEC